MNKRLGFTKAPSVERRKLDKKNRMNQNIRRKQDRRNPSLACSNFCVISCSNFGLFKQELRSLWDLWGSPFTCQDSMPNGTLGVGLPITDERLCGFLFPCEIFLSKVGRNMKNKRNFVLVGKRND